MRFENRIISASAGTGKTYRLSVEYICLLLKYYSHPDFNPDSILVITFTRKACSEIRERIISHMQELIQCQNKELLTSIRHYIPGDPDTLSIDEENKLRSVQLKIEADNRNLQVMTIDSYISSIFRNIVRPLKSIDSYSLEKNAESKRIPDLMEHLLQPNFMKMLDQILSRKVKRSMDDYVPLFKGMITNRWIYYLIRNNAEHHPSPQDPRQYDFPKRLSILINFIQQNLSKPGKKNFLHCFKSAFRDLFTQDELEPNEITQQIIRMCSNSSDAMRVLHVFQKEPICNKPDLLKEMYPEVVELQNSTLNALGEMLYYDYFLAEQEEILELWETVLTEYDRLIYRYKNFAYHDISWFTFETLFSPDPPLFKMEEASEATEFYAFLSHRSRFMLIDEFQDTSLLQFKILLPIMEEISSGYGSKDFGGVVIVGDEKQSIFGWRGGERDLLLNLRDIIPSLGNVEIEKLSHSYRAGADMIDFVNSIFSNKVLHEHLAKQDMTWDYSEVQSALGNVPGSLEYKIMGYNKNAGEKPLIYQSFLQDMILPALAKTSTESVAVLCRTNKQLADLQMLLEGENKRSIFQPSAPITMHHLVAPLISWMRYVAYGDYMDLLTVLRSDYLLISSKCLKEIVDTIYTFERQKSAPLQDLSFEKIEVANELFNLAQKQKDLPPSVILQQTIQALLIQPEEIPERDYLNLHAFLQIARDWELNHAKDGLYVAEFLDYLIENQEQEDFTQVSDENSEGIQMLSIHKSKGLQFDSVFIFYDMDNSGHSQERLYQALDFGDSGFRNVSQYALSYHYEKILPHSPLADLYSKRQKAELLEELNTLYVAFTRAKKNLHIFFAYPSKKDWGDYYDNLTNKGTAKLPHVIAECLHQYFAPFPQDEKGVYHNISYYPVSEETEYTVTDSKTSTEIKLKPPIYRQLNLAALADYPLPEGISFKEVYLDNRQALWGDIAHYYLSFIKRDLPDEHNMATRQSISRYGSLVPKAKLEELFISIRTALMEHSYLFSPDFDKIYCELEIGSHRIDRLMIDSKAMLVVIVDYKTGYIYEQDQLDIYQAELMKLPALQGYAWEKRYVMLSL